MEFFVTTFKGVLMDFVTEVFKYLIVPLVSLWAVAYCLTHMWGERKNIDRVIILMIGMIIALLIGSMPSFWSRDVYYFIFVTVMVMHIHYVLLIALMVVAPLIYKNWQRS
jgi:uncharacterized protein YacL